MARRAERQYNSRLQLVARAIKAIFKTHELGSPESIAALVKQLITYSAIIDPWAKATAASMLADVSRRNEKAWKEQGQEIGRGIRQVIAETPVGAAMREMLAEQVTLIKSLPLDAAKRVHEMVQEGIPLGTRSTEMAKKILETSNIPTWRARLIARTEVSRAATTLTQVRAQAIGSEGYIWRTSRDGDVRETHQEMEGKYVRWDSPPKTDASLPPYHAGKGPNCRCHPEPVLPDY